MENFKNLSKEAKCFFIVSGIAAFMLIAAGIDGLYDAGFFGFILGTLTFVFYGMLVGFVATVCYIIADTIAPEATKNILKKLTTEPEEDYFTNED